LEYEVIVVQRVHSWESVNILARLKKAGRRIVYDIDDDIFAIPESNPAFKAFGMGDQMAAVECMKLADLVTVSTPELQDRLIKLVGISSVMVVPNALDPDESWTPTALTGSPDKWKRIFWQGSSTHEEDWGECLGALDYIFRRRDDVRLVLLGYLPVMLQKKLVEDHWKNRVEYMGPLPPEAYFKMIKHIRAEVGLAPLKNNIFNAAKSNIKWMENALIGMPTVASNIEAYSGTIISGQDGFLCNTQQDWITSIEKCLDDGQMRKQMVGKARHRVRSEFNIKDVAQTWKRMIMGE
jgi:glycosyltransferase involved in cell wall biosynthesis